MQLQEKTWSKQYHVLEDCPNLHAVVCQAEAQATSGFLVESKSRTEVNY
jgi:hypothetical protein